MKSFIGIFMLSVMVQLALGKAVDVADTENENLVDVEKRSEYADKQTEALVEHVAREVEEKRELSDDEDDLEKRSSSQNLEDHEDELERLSRSDSLEDHEEDDIEARSLNLEGHEDDLEKRSSSDMEDHEEDDLEERELHEEDDDLEAGDLNLEE